MLDKFTDRARQTLKEAKVLALNLKSREIDSVHLLVGIWNQKTSVAYNALKNLDVRDDRLKELISVVLKKKTIEDDEDAEIQNPEEVRLPFTANTKRVIAYAAEEAKNLSNKFIGTEHILLGILHEKDSDAAKILAQFGVTLEEARKEIMGLLGKASASPKAIGCDEEEEADYKDDPNKVIEPKTQKKSHGRDTPNIDKFGVDLTELARQNKLDPCIGRPLERNRILQILARKTKNNPVLIGEPGIGKSKIVEGIAMDIVAGNVPPAFKNKRLITVDLPGMVAGTKYRGQFEERIKNFMKEVIDCGGDIILFVDELHTLVGAGGSEGGMDASNILKPALARGELQCIGATTLDEYRKYIEKDKSLERRFQPIMVDPPTKVQSLEILRGLQEAYERYHGVKFTEKALKAAVDLSDRFITGRFLPDKAIDVIDEAGSQAKMNLTVKPPILSELEEKIKDVEREKEKAVKGKEYDRAAKIREEQVKLKAELETALGKWQQENVGKSGVIDEEVIAKIVAGMTGVPVTQVTEEEKTRLLHIEEELGRSVVNQEEAITRVAQAIRRARSGLKDPKRPTGCFLFVGPTGVGKTLLCKKLAKFLFGSEESLIQLDMSEYSDKFNASKLIGAPPGYVGYEEGGQLTEPVRRRPYSVVLLDEIEKAHPDIFNMLLQIMEEGRLTDSFGRHVNFKNTIFIMTSNLGSNLLDTSSSLGFAKGSQQEVDEDSRRKTLMEAIEEAFRPEFRNRLDDTVVFKALSRENIRDIIDIEISGVKERLKEHGYDFELTEEAKDCLLEEGFSEVFGARPMKRAIEKYIENPLSEAILRGDFKDKTIIKVVVKDEEIAFEGL
jgi:ATP-dependent Clp protease ATP-binding subunit ClpC